MFPYKKTAPMWRLPPTTGRMSRKAYENGLDHDRKQSDRPNLMGNDGYMFIRFNSKDEEHCVAEGGWPYIDGDWVNWECQCRGCIPWTMDGKWAKLFYYAWGAKNVRALTNIKEDVVKDVTKEDIIQIQRELGMESEAWEAITWEDGVASDFED